MIIWSSQYDRDLAVPEDFLQALKAGKDEVVSKIMAGLDGS